MTKHLALSNFACAFLVCLAVLFLSASPALPQSATTGGLTGTVSDPSGGVIGGATVTATSLATGQERSVTTDASGTYKFSLLAAGNYSLKFSASGFKTAEVPSVTVNITETPVLNQKLEVGAQSEQVTVESTAETIQTQNATVGALVGAKEVTDLPLSSRNYTQIIDLSPGVVANVSSAAAVGNGTQDINVNGMGSDQNNYMMDGATVTNYGSGGGAQSGNFPGIGIPNPDSIQEFKIQTSQYDAEYGRNPGASVNVTTRGGTNDFHGAAWEFFRNSALDANDIFNHQSQATLHSEGIGPANKPEALNENMFGGTIGGPIKKDKLFFFGSYQGFRQLNAVGTNGFATGLATGVNLYPFSYPDGTRGEAETGSIPTDYVAGAPACGYTTYRSYLGCAFGGLQDLFGLGNHTAVNPSGSNISQAAINVLTLAGPKGGINQGFYVPGAPINGTTPLNSSISFAQPTRANEDQYLGNLDWIVNSKNTVTERFFTSKDPQNQSFVCLDGNGSLLNSCAPGAPEDVTYTADSGVLKLTTVATSSLVNEALFSFQRATTVAAPGNYITACAVGITPPLLNGTGCPGPTSGVNPIPFEIPTIAFAGIPLTGPTGYSQGPLNTGGNFFASATNFFNTFQGRDQISWNHGKHAIRTGFEVDRIQYNWTLPSRGGLIFPDPVNFLTSAPTAPGSSILVNFYGLPEANGNPHDQRTNEFSSFVEDDIKVSSKLTLNLGVRWEYDGYPSENKGLFTDVWTSQLTIDNTGSFYLGNEGALGGTVPCPNFSTCAPGTLTTTNNQVGSLAGYVVQSNYNPNIAACGNPLARTACGLIAPAGIFPGYPGGAEGVIFNTNKTLVKGAPIDDFGPRIGLAWQPIGENLVIRAGYGIFYDAVYANLLANNNAGNGPYNGFADASYFANSLQQPIASAATGGILGWSPRTLQVVSGNAATGATNITDDAGGNGLPDTSDNQHLAVPLVQSYNLDVQYQVLHNWILDVGYVGSHGTHLYDWANPVNLAFLVAGAPNEPTDPQNLAMVVGSNALGTPNSLPFNDVNNVNPATRVTENLGSTSAAGPDNTLGRVSYLGYGTGGASTTKTQGDSLYNSLQVQLKHQFSHGFLLQASYTWSKLITNVNSSEAGGGIAAPGNVLSGGASSNDPLNLGQQYGLAAFNRPQRLIIAYSYDIPYHNTQGFSGKLLGGWSLSGVTTIQDGEPFTVIDSNAGVIYYGRGGTPFGGGGVRAELADATNCNHFGVCQSGTSLATSGGDQSRLGGAFGGPGWINAAGFANAPCIGGTPNPGGNPADACGAGPSPFIPGDLGYPFLGAGTGFGNSAVGAIMGPGQNNWDFSLMKTTKITEGLSFQFRSEFYNIWNHAQFNPPINNRADATFGQIQSSSVPPRIMQFAVKFLF
jgi:Carboxypeptidase regulatory-like domain/TonB-dependent Receptor Plug Domain